MGVHSLNAKYTHVCNIYHLRVVVEQVYCLRDMVEELHMEQTNNTNLALLFEVKE